MYNGYNNNKQQKLYLTLPLYSELVIQFPIFGSDDFKVLNNANWSRSRVPRKKPLETHASAKQP